MKTRIFGYKGGTFSPEELEKARANGNPLTLDMAIQCGCLNNCSFCGYKDTQKGDKLTSKEIRDTIYRFSEIGGKSVKILGEGEPLLRKDILDLFDYTYGLGLQPVLFTCGDVLGDDELAKKIHGVDGVNIVRRLNNSQTTVMLKYESKNQDQIVQREGYSKLRDRALERLIEEGFNNSSPTRLGFGIVILSANYNEIPKTYTRAIKENIYPLLCPLMPIGKASEKEYRDKIGVTPEKIVELSTRLYNIAKENGIEVTCPADFPGGLPCDISRAGFYIGDTGDIYLCESEEKIGNVKEISLREAWTKIKEIKDKKYGTSRWKGQCYTKRAKEILTPCFDQDVLLRLKGGTR